MIVSGNDLCEGQHPWVLLYDRLLAQKKEASPQRVYAYVSATDCDSVCALRILEVSLWFGGRRGDHSRASALT